MNATIKSTTRTIHDIMQDIGNDRVVTFINGVNSTQFCWDKSCFWQRNITTEYATIHNDAWVKIPRSTFIKNLVICYRKEVSDNETR